jgi:hypothetical protein
MTAKAVKPLGEEAAPTLSRASAGAGVGVGTGLGVGDGVATGGLVGSKEVGDGNTACWQADSASAARIPIVSFPISRPPPPCC